MIRPTSKASLKTTCLLMANGDIDKAERLYDFYAKDMPDMPLYDAPTPSWVDNTKDTLNGLFSFLGDHKDGLSQGYEIIRALFNTRGLMNYVDSLRAIAPNGYVTQWECTPIDSTAVDVKLGYVNMNEKAVKAVDAYFQLADSEGKVLKNAHAKVDCTIEYMQQGEVQTKFPFAITEGMEMKLTKVVVIYADGTKAAGKI